MKKGFTLVELLAVVTVLGFIGLVAFPSIVNILEESKRKDFMNDVNSLSNVTETYMAENWSEIGSVLEDECIFISYSDLVSEGLVDTISNFDAYIVFFNNSANEKVESYIFASSDIYHVEGVGKNFDKANLQQGNKDFSSIFDAGFYMSYTVSISGDILVLNSI